MNSTEMKTDLVNVEELLKKATLTIGEQLILCNTTNTDIEIKLASKMGLHSMVQKTLINRKMRDIDCMLALNTSIDLETQLVLAKSPDLSVKCYLAKTRTTLGIHLGYWYVDEVRKILAADTEYMVMAYLQCGIPEMYDTDFSAYYLFKHERIIFLSMLAKVPKQIKDTVIAIMPQKNSDITLSSLIKTAQILNQ